eukprot:960720-Alexandrium_andersonii.AAC.1
MPRGLIKLLGTVPGSAAPPCAMATKLAAARLLAPHRGLYGAAAAFIARRLLATCPLAAADEASWRAMRLEERGVSLAELRAAWHGFAGWRADPACWVFEEAAWGRHRTADGLAALAAALDADD